MVIECLEFTVLLEYKIFPLLVQMCGKVLKTLLINQQTLLRKMFRLVVRCSTKGICCNVMRTISLWVSLVNSLFQLTLMEF